ncbi:MAG: hypothetical protein WC441_05420 [Patescibacteria group bacterium]
MAGFKLAKPYDNVDEEEVTISSLTLSVGDLLERDIGATACTVADTATEHWQRKYVCTESATSSDTTVNTIPVNNEFLWEVESANNSNADHNGDRMALTDKNTVNNSGTDDTSEEACVIQVGVLGAAAEKRILVRFLDSSGVNPDAT